MQPDPLVRLTEAIDRLSDRVEQLENRLIAWEVTQVKPPSAPANPEEHKHARAPLPGLPVVTPLMSDTPRFPPPPVAPSQPLPKWNEKPEVEPPSALNLEYLLGARTLPWLAAVLISIGVVSLVSLGYTRGWLTPLMVFALAVAGCLVMIGVGQWKRDEREQFGEILTGIGSCGLYLSFAAGYGFHGLFSGETLVVLFMGLSALNLSYGVWRRSKAFFWLGTTGGFAASLLPLESRQFEMAAALHLAALVGSLGICARLKWTFDAIVAAWAGFFVGAAVTFVSFGVSTASWRDVHLVVVTMVGVLGMVASSRAEAEQGTEWAAPFLLVVGCLAAVPLYERGYRELLLSLGMAVGAIGLSRIASWNPIVRERLFVTALYLALVRSPLALGELRVGTAYTILAIIVAMVAALKREKGAFPLGAVLLCCAFVTYLWETVRDPYRLTPAVEALWIVLLLWSLIALCVCAAREGKAQTPAALAFAATWIAVTRLTVIWVETTGAVKMNPGMSLIWTLFGTMLVVAGFRLRIAEVRLAGLLVYATTAGKIIFVDLANTDVLFRTIISLVLGLVMLIASYAFIRTRPRSVE